MPKKLTPNQRMFAKEVKRIKSFIRSAEKRGYIFTVDIDLTRPKVVRQRDIQRLKRLTPDALYGKSYFILEQTGEAVTGLEGRKIERYRAAKKGWMTRRSRFDSGAVNKAFEDMLPNAGEIIYNRLLEMASQYSTGGARILTSYLKQQYALSGNAFLQKIVDAGEEAISEAQEIIYESSVSENSIREIETHLNRFAELVGLEGDSLMKVVGDLMDYEENI